MLFSIMFILPFHAQTTTIRQEILLIQKDRKVHFIYDSKIKLDKYYVGPPLKRQSLNRTLKLLFNNTDIQWNRKGNNIILEEKHKEPPFKNKLNKRNNKIRSFTVSGYVKDINNESLINATIYDKSSRTGTMTNAYGFFSMTLLAGRHSLRISYIGYAEDQKEINLEKNMIIKSTLHENSTMEEVVVEGNLNSPLLTTQTGKRTLTSKDINTEFSLLSSPDVIKTLQRISGVSSGVELASGLYVHGGEGDENLFLLDGTPLYQTNHSLGLFSSFNTDIINNVDFYKSGFPARYSGRLSSITDVRTKDGDYMHYHGSYSIGLLDGKFDIEGPIIKGKTSFVFGLRRTWIDLLLKPAFAIINHGNGDGDKYSFGYMFHDLNAKITHHISDRSKMSLSLYSGVDHYNINDKSVWSDYTDDCKNDFKWGNFNFAFNWNYQASSKLFANIAAVYTYNHSISDYTEDDTELLSDNMLRRTSLDIQHNHSKIYDFGIKADFDCRPNNHHKINFGGSYSCLMFRPQTTLSAFYFSDSGNDVDTTETRSANFKRSHEMTLYVEDEIRLTDRLSTDVGINYSLFSTSGKNYHNIDPRLALKYQFNNCLSAKASYTVMTQYVHRIASTYLEMPTDYWVPTTSTILPAYSSQFAFGVYSQPAKELTVSLEGFYKYTHHVMQYHYWMGLQPPASRWDKDVIDGTGRSYGLELDGYYKTKNY